MSPASTRTISSLRADMVEALSWILSLGAAPGRFHQMLQDVEYVDNALQTRTVGKLSDPAEHRACQLALVEALDLVHVYRAFSGEQDLDELRRRLTKAATGPRSGSTELTEKHAGGRNVLAELSWAATLRLNGWAADLDPRADVVSVLEGSSSGLTPALLWEVKRPLSISGLEHLVVKGARQVRDIMLEPHPKYDFSGGCVVVSLDHSPLPAVIDATSPDTVSGTLPAGLTAFGLERSHIWRKARKDGVLGLVLRWRPMARIQDVAGTIVPFGCEQIAFVRLHRDPPPLAAAVEAAILQLTIVT